MAQSFVTSVVNSPTAAIARMCGFCCTALSQIMCMSSGTFSCFGCKIQNQTMLLEEVNAKDHWGNELGNNDEIVIDHRLHFVKLDIDTNIINDR